MSPEDYCRERAAPLGSDIHYSLLFVDETRRPALLALYALRHELNRLVEESREPSVAQTKLGWWQQELQRWSDGRPQHPVTQTLGDAGTRFGLGVDHLQDIVDGTAADLEYNSYPSFRELSQLSHRLGSSPHLAIARILGFQDSRSNAFAHDLGAALFLAGRLFLTGHHVRQGRFYCPEDDMAQCRLDHRDLAHGTDSDASRALFRRQAERIRDLHRRALEQLPVVDRAAQSHQLILATLIMRRLDEVEAADFPLLSQQINLTPLRKLWITWRMHWQLGRRSKQDTIS